MSELFGRLLATRLTSQTADGFFQTSLAGAVLFNPEHHTGPAQVAGGLVVLLLPYSLIGPFAGVFLDRWRRQRVLVYGAAVRSVLVVASAGLLVESGPHRGGFRDDRTRRPRGQPLLPRCAVRGAAQRRRRRSGWSWRTRSARPPAPSSRSSAPGSDSGCGQREAAATTATGWSPLVAAAGYAAAAFVGSRLPAGSLGPAPAEHGTAPTSSWPASPAASPPESATCGSGPSPRMPSA